MNFSQELTANQLGYDPIDDANWDFQTIPYAWPSGAVVKILANAEDANVRCTVMSGTTTLQLRSPVSIFGTVGILPTDFDTMAITFLAAPGDKVKVQYDEVAGGTPVVQGVIQIEPL